MSRILKWRAAGTVLLLLVGLCSCATKPAGEARLPAEVAMNKDAGHGSGDWVMATIKLDNGRRIPFVLDTGAAMTVFDKSLAPMLGKPSGSGTATNFGKERKMEIYHSPKLYLGGARLQMTGDFVGTYDCQNLMDLSKRRVMGILGMDVLEHYCVQMDFEAGKLRFLDDEHADRQNWGKAFPLFDTGDGCCVIHDNLAGMKNPDARDGVGVYSLIDTGHDFDGWLSPEFYERWTNTAQPPKNGEARSPNAVLDGEKYAEVYPDKRDEKLKDPHTAFNGIGIHFLSRHLVTLDFPKKTMYLRRTRELPFIDENVKARAKAEARSAVRFAERLKRKGELPGWSKHDERQNTEINFDFYEPDTVTFAMQKEGKSDLYHFTMTREAKSSVWKVEKAWRTDANGKTLEEYPVK